jgi:hypothetical protein
VGWLARWYGDEDALGRSLAPEPVTDTDKIIAAQREQAEKTRSLLVVIFVVIPIMLLIIGGLIWLIASATQ